MLWILGAVGALVIQRAAVEEDPAAMPGGGPPAMALIALSWPIVAVLVVVGAVLMLVGELRR